jgi:hypothetical protein
MAELPVRDNSELPKEQHRTTAKKQQQQQREK